MAVAAADIPNVSRDVNASHAVRGVDTLRFFAAGWVALYHGAAFPIERVLPPVVALKLPGLGRLPFNGMAAVVVFFVISGFCIHYHNVGKVRLSWLRFLLQRAVRIVAPLICVMFLARYLGPDFYGAVHAVLWSVFCEIAYYALYPVIFLLIAKGRLTHLIIGSTGVSFILGCLWPRLVFLGDMGNWTWIYCLPMWLAGCALAERYKRRLSRSDLRAGARVCRYRLGAICFGSLAAILSRLPMFPVGYIWTMPLFTVYSMAWLLREFDHARSAGTVQVFERWGTAAYSMYLTHKLAICAVTKLQVHWFLAWSLDLVAIAVFAIAFYFLVERPSHLMSKWIGHQMKDLPASSLRSTAH